MWGGCVCLDLKGRSILLGMFVNNKQKRKEHAKKIADRF